VRSGVLAGVWAIAGVVALFVEAAWRLAVRGIITVRAGLEPVEWLILILLTAAFVWGEGVRALQRRWIPGVYRRIDALRDEPRLSYRVLAPLYAMSLIGASRSTLARAWLGVVLIVAAVFIVRALPEPWRGIIDIGVAAALTWGLLVLLYHSRGLFRRPNREM
jgi:hypothetical protein